jgi:bifunctional UDP-N-acetylglucosamine pyrophosphorylase/glucosamine-1-phosphate N-acetyltransferase
MWRCLQALFRLIAAFTVAYHSVGIEMDSSRVQEDRESDRAARERVLESLKAHGVDIQDPDRTYVDEHADVGSGTVLLPGTHVRGASKIGSNCRIGPDCWIEDSVVESGCRVWYSVLESARVREQTHVGPYAHLRPGADVGPEARIGNFVEVKAARLERGVKAGHLTYIGDADVGEGANVGAGTVTCNYDGMRKHRTVIEDGVFVGSNVALVAPVRIGQGAFIAAGSTITEDVPPKKLALGRARQIVKDQKKAEQEETWSDGS